MVSADSSINFDICKRLMLTLSFITVNANIFGQLFDTAFFTAVERIVETAVEKAVKKTISPAVDDAVDKAMKQAVPEVVQTVLRKASQAIWERFAFDRSLPLVTNSEDFNIVEDFSEYASDFILPDCTYNIYCELRGMYSIIGIDEKHELTLVSPKKAKGRNVSISSYEWECGERGGFYFFYNQLLEKYLSIHYENIKGVLLMAFSEDHDNRFGVQRNSKDAYKLQHLCDYYLLPVIPGWSEEFWNSDETEVDAIMENTRGPAIPNDGFVWKFRKVRDYVIE